MSQLPPYERLGAFYLGRPIDRANREMLDEPLLYDAKDLTTHAVCVEMTGSGKTGLCVTLLEEAAIDGIPAIAIDPKGDLGNLMLAFPGLRPADFEPWVDDGAARRKGMTVPEYAVDRAGLWKKGLADWGQDGARIRRYLDAVDVAIYTPGSDAGLPLTVLRSFTAPPPDLVADREAMRQRVSSATSGLLALTGLDVDPIRSREHILVSSILDRAWRDGRDLDLGALIAEIQKPPFEKLGVMDLESFFPDRDRFELALTINNLLASPGFGSWMEGEPLDIQRLLYGTDGRPRLSILSIAHLSEAERMFFVTLLLNEVVAWVRTQPGTSSLRALLYMDEVFGFLPPTANPPSKLPLLTLLKQARAYGLGVVLATQNPVDLDYKALSNAGTWFLGRLQTERDKARMIDGLEGAVAAAGTSFDRRELDTLLSGLDSREFLMNNVHEDEPVLFHTRWAMSYLRGPLTRPQIQTLMAGRKRQARASAETGAAVTMTGAAAGAHATAVADRLDVTPPPLPPDIEQGYLKPTASSDRVMYRPALLGQARLHYVRTSVGVDDWHDAAMLVLLDEEPPADPWPDGDALASKPALRKKPPMTGGHATLPAEAAQARHHKRWVKSLVDHLYRERPLTIWRSRKLERHSEPGEDEGAFRVRLRDTLRERRDLRVEKLRRKYGPKLKTLEERLRKAEQAVGRERGQARQRVWETGLSAVLGIFTRRSMSTAARSAGRAVRERGDIKRAEENVEALEKKLEDLRAEAEAEIDAADDIADPDDVDLEEIVISPRKSDMRAGAAVTLVWTPWRMSGDGMVEPAYEVEGIEGPTN